MAILRKYTVYFTLPYLHNILIIRISFCSRAKFLSKIIIIFVKNWASIFLYFISVITQKKDRRNGLVLFIFNYPPPMIIIIGTSILFYVRF